MHFLTKVLQEAPEAIFELENDFFLHPSKALLSITMGSEMVFEVQKVLGKQYKHYWNDLGRIWENQIFDDVTTTKMPLL